MKTLYTPFDGDFNPGDIADLERLVTDILGDSYTGCVELCASLETEAYPLGIIKRPDPPYIWFVVDFGSDEDGWDDSSGKNLPDHWPLERVAQMFSLGNIYFRPVKKGS